MSLPLLATLDAIRRRSGTPAPGPLVRQTSADGSEVRIAYSACPASALPNVIRRELCLAHAQGARFEWKLYGHDQPACLGPALQEAGLIAGDRETVLALDLHQLPENVKDGLAAALPTVRASITQLADYARISRDSGRRNVEVERAQLAETMTADPDRLQVHIVYVDGVPISGGRLHLDHPSAAAELAGGRTIPAQRQRGHFTRTVFSRIAAAIEAGAETLWVDALPTSAPILTKLGFQPVTWTQPYVAEGATDSR
ncbi:hypothetical protein [Buchananella hordeovulneris]|uniref:hypothetical protein n=1 Tax=Buchananella hordeovulneris TaxID=52770 RepID=UPI000F5F0BB3|nr:hypothetical protein [Buchananella hordeovulneris]RRD44915.1 hypothetical protein EII13_01765 [Buchananella hordeovulneris]